MDTKICPFCGETVMASAKKCRFCGEWFDASQSAPAAVPTAVPTAVPVEQAYAQPDTAMPVSVYNPGLPPVAVNEAMPPVTVGAPMSAATPQQPMNAGQQAIGGTNVMPQINVNVVQQVQQENHQEQETTVVVAAGSSEGGSTWWLWTQLLAIAGLVWGVSGHWWVALLTLFGLGVAMFIPGLGQAMCVILAAGVAILSGVFSAAFGAPTWAAWIIGIIAGLVCASSNLESRKTIIEED